MYKNFSLKNNLQIEEVNSRFVKTFVYDIHRTFGSEKNINLHDFANLVIVMDRT